jgi:hypothetical protein
MVLAEEEASPAADASLRPRRTRTHKILELDETTELHNQELANWNTDYVENMRLLNREKLAKQAARQAKNNAEFWVFGGRLGGLTPGPLARPLQDYCNAALYELSSQRANGFSAGEKRKRDGEVEGESEEGRQVRQRGEHDGSGRETGVELLIGEDVDMGRLGDEEVSDGLQAYA